MPNIGIAMVPGHTGVQSKEQLRENILGVTQYNVVNALLEKPADGTLEDEPSARDIVATGTLDEINEYFITHELSDGLPIMPPTQARIDAFLRYTERKPDEVLGILLPDMRAATIWSIAVNGVMAGCRPEYMPVLVALIEAMCDPYYGNEHSGNTFGFSVRLAYLMAERPDLIAMEHGALCPLVGCKDYGCYSMRAANAE